MALSALLACILLGPALALDNEVFSSTTELRKLFKQEGEVVEKLNDYAAALEKDLRIIKKYIGDFKKIEEIEDEDNTAEIVANPFNAYHILKRTTVDWEEVISAVRNSTKNKDLAGEVISRSENLPTFEDFIGGSMALVGLQDTYSLNLSDIIHGTIKNHLPPSPYHLSARDCLFLGKAAFNKGLYDRAINWLEMALIRADEEADTDGVSAKKDEILPFLETTRRVHDEILEKKGPVGENWQTFDKPLSSKLAQKKKYSEVKKYKPKIYKLISPHEENENFKMLCRDEELRTPKLDARLRCRYRKRENTVSFLGPFKIEEKSLDPYIILVYDFMTETEMAEFRDFASSRLRRSLHQGKNGNYVATDIRTSKQAWLTKDDGISIKRVTNRINEATGLVLWPENEASELFQVANYGMGGRYTPHTDYITGKDHYTNPVEILRGNRIATFMVYLQNVHAGGSTVFPLIGVKVKPVKGTAVFWWNLRRDGKGDQFTRHGACPVLYGDKWIANKWIRSNNQMMTAPCLPDQDSGIKEL